MASFLSHITLEDLAKYSQPNETDISESTPVLKAVIDARSKAYDGICIPLTTDKWRARWKDLCLVPDDANLDKAAQEQLAEQWRANPVFMQEEVSITRLGSSLCPLFGSCNLTS